MLTVFESTDDLIKNSETNNVSKIVDAKPTTAETKTPYRFFVLTGISFFRFVSFLRIEKSLTFNKEYEGLFFIMIKLFFVFILFRLLCFLFLHCGFCSLAFGLNFFVSSMISLNCIFFKFELNTVRTCFNNNCIIFY